VTEQGYPPRQPGHSGRGRSGTRHDSRESPASRNSGWQMLDAFDSAADHDSEVPPWAGPGIEPVRPVRRSRAAQPASRVAPQVTEEEPEQDRPAPKAPSPRRSRAAETRRRRSRRRLVTWGVAAVVIIILAGVGYYVSRPSPPPQRYVTTLLKGEYSTVPNACKVLSAPALRQFLGGNPPKGVQSSSGGGKSDCTYQFDAKPIFRVLDITIAAYSPSLIAPGDGSATSYATYTFNQTKQVFVQPPKHLPQPPAKVTTVALGNEALSAAQVYHVGPVQDRATVVARWHNVLITASLWATASGGFGPVSMSQLEAGALGAARATLTVVKAQPAVQ